MIFIHFTDFGNNWGSAAARSIAKATQTVNLGGFWWMFRSGSGAICNTANTSIWGCSYCWPLDPGNPGSGSFVGLPQGPAIRTSPNYGIRSIVGSSTSRPKHSPRTIRVDSLGCFCYTSCRRTAPIVPKVCEMYNSYRHLCAIQRLCVSTHVK